MFSRAAFNKLSLAVAIALGSTSAMAVQLEEIVVTAQKREQNLQDVPISLDVIQAEQLSDRGISSVDGLAQATPSLIFQKGNSPSGNNFIIRGIGSIGLEGGIQPSVSMTIDGVPLGRLSEFSSEMGDIERIEVLRGPQGTLYGRNATGGVINIVRKAATDEFAAYVEQTITDDDEYTTRVMVNGALSDNVAGRLSGFYTDRDAYIKNLLSGPDVGAEESYGILGRLAIEVSDTLNIGLDIDYRKLDTGEGTQSIARVEGQPGDTVAPTDLDPVSGMPYSMIGTIRTLAIGNGDAALGQKVISDPFTSTTDFDLKNDTENYGFALTVDWDLSENTVLKSITAYRNNEQYGHPDVDYTPATAANNPFGAGLVTLDRTNLGPDVGSKYTTTNIFEYHSQEFRLEGSTDKMEWLAGVYYNHNEETAESEVPLYIFNGAVVRSDPRDVGVEFDSYSAFGDITYSVSDNFKLFAGLRWTMEDLDSRVNNVTYTLPTALFPAFGITNGVDLIVGDSSTYINPAIFGFGALAPVPLSATVTLPAGTPFGAVATSAVQFEASDRSEDWSGRLGGSYDVNDDLQIYFSASRGFVGAGANIGRVVDPNSPTLEPSISTAYELGFKSDLFDGSVRLNGSIFSQEVTDLQTTRILPGTINTVSFNAGTLDIQGMEMSLTWGATELLTLDASVSYLDTEVKDLEQPCYLGQSAAQGCNIPVLNSSNNIIGYQQDVSGNEMVQAPELAYNLNARLDIPTGDLPFDMYTSLAYTWQDDIQFNLSYDPLTVQESYGLIDLTVAIEDRQGDWKVTLFGKNLGDEDYSVNLTGGGGYATQGRVMSRITRGSQTYWGVKARYNF